MSNIIKDIWLKHPYAVGATVTAGTVLVTIGSGPIGWIVGLAAVGAGGGVSKSIADEFGNKEEGKKDG